MKEFGQVLFPRWLTSSDQEIDHKLWSRVAELKSGHKSESVINSSIVHGLRAAQWLGYYRGEIPAAWEDSHQIVATVKAMSQMDFKLNDKLTKAVLAHPTTFVVLEMAGAQKLSADQLAIVIARRDLPHYVKDNISNRQRINGADHAVWREAGKIAKKQGQALIPHLCYRPNLIP